MNMNFDFTPEKLELTDGDQQYALHPIWVRERSQEEDSVDQNNYQRLYDPECLQHDLRFSNIKLISENDLLVEFSDHHKAKYKLTEIIQELRGNISLPKKILWNAQNVSHESFNFSYDKNESEQLIDILEFYHKYGFVIVNGLKPKEGEIIDFAERIGFVRETNFGKTFNVISVQDPNDLAYTSIELGSHTDNPYRKPIPSIQFLFCIENTTIGGDSTIVDGYKVARDLQKSNPEAFDTLSNINVKFRFQDKDSILENEGKIIELDDMGELSHIRFSNRLDFVPHSDWAELEKYYSAKRIFHSMINSPDYMIKFRLDAGSLLIVDNYRVLHGRTSFNTSEGNRFLQGLYIDHDSIESKYKVLKQNI